MSKFVNRAWMSSTTTGSATSIVLGAALSGYQSFAAAGISDGDTVTYTIIDGANWEIGTGVYTSSGTLLSRNVVESSNSDNPITLSGDATIFITANATTDLPNLKEQATWSAVQGYAETSITWNGSATSSWNVANAPNGILEASNGNTELNATGVVAGRYYHLRFVQGATARTITWNSQFKFIDDEAPTLSQDSGAVDHFTFYGRASQVLEEVGRAQNVA